MAPFQSVNCGISMSELSPDEADSCRTRKQTSSQLEGVCAGGARTNLMFKIAVTLSPGRPLCCSDRDHGSITGGGCLKIWLPNPLWLAIPESPIGDQKEAIQEKAGW